MIGKNSLLSGVAKSLGLVFRDIGTSPIYTLSVVFLLTRPTPEHVIGILSLIVWTLIILVSLEYAWLAMSLGERGEGGTIVLKKILVRLRQAAMKDIPKEREEELKKEIARGREEIIRTILTEAQKIVPQYGIELVDVRIKRLD